MRDGRGREGRRCEKRGRALVGCSIVKIEVRPSTGIDSAAIDCRKEVGGCGLRVVYYEVLSNEHMHRQKYV